MATVAVQVVTEEIDKISTENSICETRSETVTEALVALPSKNTDDDSGILTCTNSNDEIEKKSSQSSEEPSTEKTDKQSSQESRASSVEKSLTGKSDEHENQLSQEQGKLSFDSKSSQESRASTCTTKSNSSSVSKTSQSASSRYINEDSNSSSNSTLKENHDEDSRSSVSSSTSTVKNSQHTPHKSDDESNSRSSFESLNKRSQHTTDKSGDESNSRSSFKSPNKRSQHTTDKSGDESNSRSSFKSSNKGSQHTTYKSDDESNSRSSFPSPNKRSSPVKQSDNESRSKRSQSTHADDDSHSTATSLNSKSTTKNSQSIIDKSDDESNTRSSFQSVSKNATPDKSNDSRKSSPEKDSDKENTRPKKLFNIIDSDSDDDIFVPQRPKVQRKQKGSDSDGSESSKSSKSGKKRKIKNKKTFIDSDSDGESIKIDKSSRKKETDSEASNNESDKEEFKSLSKSNKISNIVDSESESGSDNQSDQRDNVSSGEENDTEKKGKEKKKSEKKRTGSARASKDAAMQQIHSETQRLIREAEITLPYHRPKQRTLQEFLNRKKITSDIPKNLTFAEKVKMFPDIISKVVEEKEEEAEIFYKSSDSEEEKDEPMEVDEVATAKNATENKNENEISALSNIADTQKLTQDHIQDSHDKITILQQRSLDFGVPRKLFLEDDDKNELSENVPVPEESTNADENINTNITNHESKSREIKSGIREASIPRKLFTGEEMDMEIDTNDGLISASEEKDKEISYIPDNVDKTVESTEEIVLNFSETEHDVSDVQKTSESNKINCLDQNKIQESITISETPFISNKEIAETIRASSIPPNDKIIIEENKSSNQEELKDADDLILELASESKNEDDEEILDPDILRANFALPKDLDEPVKKRSLKDIILANVSENKPRIKASPGSIIDFTSGPGQLKEGVTKLLDRFVRHSVVHKHNVNEIAEIKTIRTEGSGNDIIVVEETLPFSKTITEDDPKKDKKPGEKLKILREDLKRKIASARNEEWKKREEQEKEDEEEETKCKGDDFYEGLPDEEEELEDEVSTESEPEEDDIPMKESRRPKCAFGDEEAEVSEDENAVDVDGDENEEDEEEGDEEEEEEAEEEEEEEEKESEKEEMNDKPKVLKRIIRPFDEDSSESKSSLSNDAKPKLFLTNNRVRKTTDEDMFASQMSNGSEDLETDSIPPFQSRDRCGSDLRSQACKTPLPKPNNLLSMMSPITQLTALNATRDSAKKSASKTPNPFNLGPISASVENTPTENSDSRPQTNCNMEKMINLQKKLFEDPPETVNEDELLEICSGRFTQNSEKPANTQNEVTDSQLLELCSGAFDSQPVDMKKLESNNTCSSRPEFGDETSQDITLTLDDDEESKCSPTKTASSLKRSDESMFSSDSKSSAKSSISGNSNSKNPMEAWLKRGNNKSTAQTQPKSDQITDSQLMDLCSGAFTSQAVNLKELEKDWNDSPQIHGEASQDFNLSLDDNLKNPLKPTIQSQNIKLLEQSNKLTALDDDSNAPKTKYRIASSSDEDDGETKQERPKKKLVKKKVKKLTLSDDEDEDEMKEFSDEEESEIEEEDEEEEEKFVDYDSEENEVVVVPKKEIKKVAKNFLENEAELSESEWGSDDEDEQGMDKLEFEEGDVEDIDEDKMKEQLDRVRMKQVMDEDQREVRMIQELLFDDGDLHSEGGRERKFRWKNIDSLGDLGLTPRSNDYGEGVDDEIDIEAEVQRRKIRYEQQKFLEEKQNSLDVEINEDFNENQLFNRGLKVVSFRSTSKSSIEEQKLVKSNSVVNSTNMLIANGITNVSTKKTFTSTSLSFSNMRGSFLSRGEETLVRIAKNLPETTKTPSNIGRTGNFVFQHLSPSVSHAPQDNLEQDTDNTPATEKNKRKRKMFASQGASQTPRSTKKLKVDDKVAGKKLF